MRWRIPQSNEFRITKRFAWLPITLETEKIWLELYITLDIWNGYAWRTKAYNPAPITYTCILNSVQHKVGDKIKVWHNEGPYGKVRYSNGDTNIMTDSVYGIMKYFEEDKHKPFNDKIDQLLDE